MPVSGMVLRKKGENTHTHMHTYTHTHICIHTHTHTHIIHTHTHTPLHPKEFLMTKEYSLSLRFALTLGPKKVSRRNFGLKWPWTDTVPGAWQKKTQEFQKFLGMQFNEYMHKNENSLNT